MPKRRLVVSLAVALCALALPTIASADVKLGAPNQLVREDGSTAPGQMGTQSTPESGLFRCNLPFSTVANTPGGYALGNCPQHAHLFRTIKSYYVSSPPAGYFDGGYVSGTFDGCGWIYEDYSIKEDDRSNSGCPSPSKDPSEFMLYANCASPCQDGTQILNPRSCPAYANYRPWSTANRPTNYVGTFPANAKHTNGTPRIRWRYTSKYPSTDGSGHYVMVRDTMGSAGYGNWLFIPYSCLA